MYAVKRSIEKKMPSEETRIKRQYVQGKRTFVIVIFNIKNLETPIPRSIGSEFAASLQSLQKIFLLEALWRYQHHSI